MQKKTFLVWGLAIIMCLSLLAGCIQSSGTTSSSVTTTSSVSTTQNSTTSSQNVIVNMPSFAGLINIAQPCVVEIDVSATISTGRRSNFSAARAALRESRRLGIAAGARRLRRWRRRSRGRLSRRESAGPFSVARRHAVTDSRPWDRRARDDAVTDGRPWDRRARDDAVTGERGPRGRAATGKHPASAHSG